MYLRKRPIFLALFISLFSLAAQSQPQLLFNKLTEEEGLEDLPQVRCTDAGLARLKNGNPGMVVASDIDYGEECWASHDGRAVAVGRFKAGELHPSRVFNQ